jgi:hypothetical protein
VSNEVTKSKFEIMCEKYENRINNLESQLCCINSKVMQLSCEAVCLSRGGHEFEKVQTIGFKVERCKYCLKEKGGITAVNQITDTIEEKSDGS